VAQPIADIVTASEYQTFVPACTNFSNIDDSSITSKAFLIHVDSTLQFMAANKNEKEDGLVTVDENRPKVRQYIIELVSEANHIKSIFLGSTNSNGFRRFPVSGTYAIANLLQDLWKARDEGFYLVELNHVRLQENPVTRLRDLIKHLFWDHLTRRLDANVIKLATHDDKAMNCQLSRLYIPAVATTQYTHYTDMAQKNPRLNLVVEKLPSRLTPDEYMMLNKKPGLLALDMDEEVDSLTGKLKLKAVPFVVPGGIFNEFFGWDSYFVSLGLLTDGKTGLVKSVIRNWIFEIQHYGLIPNANRSYLMLRSQPPFLTDLCLRLYCTTRGVDSEAKVFLKRGIEAAIKEYHSVWMNPPRLDLETGLSRYRPNGAGIPPEVDLDFFAPILEPYSRKYGISCNTLAERFNLGEIDEPDLESYFLHDRATRESGHDTQNRLENRTADLAIIDLNFLLYKFETDIAFVIRHIFEDRFEISKEFALPSSLSDTNSSTWYSRASSRKDAINKFLWNEDQGIYLDYNTRTKRQEAADSATCLWALWCGVASTHQAKLLVQHSLPLFECVGGLASSSEKTAFMYTRRLYQCQWDYPHGWAPHQIMAWDGLRRYGYYEEAGRLAYKWLLTVLKVFVNYNGAVVEKYDVTRFVSAHQVNTEYPNQGSRYHGYVIERDEQKWNPRSFY
jgi:alpha,alpha-trehalase